MSTRILVVEDEAIIARGIERRLKALGYDVAALASSGEEAVAKAEETRPDLILMDINLGKGMDGLEAANRIRAQCGVPVVFLTAYSDDATLQRAKKAEPFGYIRKPYEDKDLQTAVEIAVYRHEVECRLQAAYERERRIAEVLQRPLLLRIREDAVPGLSVATFYEPALSEAEVGGDFFDVVPLTGGRVALVVGDTCGKGLEAAVHNSQIRDVLRAFLRESPCSAAAVMGRLNNVVCDSFEIIDQEPEFWFVALALLILDTNSGEASYVSAGAEPLLVVRTGGVTEAVEHPGLLLGVERNASYQERALRLEMGDTAVLVTDGITEARYRGEFLGGEGLAQLACGAVQAPTVTEAGQAILSGVHAFAAGGLRDDACLVLARRRATAQTAHPT